MGVVLSILIPSYAAGYFPMGIQTMDNWTSTSFRDGRPIPVKNPFSPAPPRKNGQNRGALAGKNSKVDTLDSFQLIKAISSNNDVFFWASYFANKALHYVIYFFGSTDEIKKFSLCTISMTQKDGEKFLYTGQNWVQRNIHAACNHHIRPLGCLQITCIQQIFCRTETRYIYFRRYLDKTTGTFLEFLGH